MASAAHLTARPSRVRGAHGCGGGAASTHSDRRPEQGSPAAARQERRLLLRSAPCAQRCGSSGRPARFSRGGCLVTTRWRGPRAHTLEGGARGCQAPRARVGCMRTGSASPQLGRPLQEAGADPVPRVWRPSAHPPGARPAPVAEQKPAAAWPPATGVFPRSASRVPTRLCPAPSFTSDVAQTLSCPQKAPPDSDRGGTPRGRGERCGPVQSSCVPFLFSLITIVFLILKSCSRKGSDTVTFKWRLKAARSQAVGRRGALSSQKQARILGRNPGQQGVCPAGGGTGAETREGPAQGQEWRERGVTPAGATEAGLRGTPGEQPWAPVPMARMEVRGLPGMAARLSHLRWFPRKSQRQEAAPRCAPWAWLAGGANGEAPPTAAGRRPRDSRLGCQAALEDDFAAAQRGHVQTDPTASELPDGLPSSHASLPTCSRPGHLMFEPEP